MSALLRPLGELCKTTSGGTPSRSKPHYFEGTIPWVKSGELPDGIVIENSEYITDEAISNSSAKLLPAGTLLVALYGATVGKLGILSRPAATNQAVCAIFPSESIDTKFLFWYLLAKRPWLIGQAAGGAQPNISQGVVRSLMVPVMPLAAQHEIVAEIEKQFSRLDEAVANLQRVKANLKRYKASVLKDAVDGRLVPLEAELARREGRSFETGEQLLQRILETRRSSWTGRGKFKTPPAPETAWLADLPIGWVWTSVEQIADVISGLTKNPTRETLPLKLPYLRVANVYANELRLGDMAEIGVADNELQKLLVLKNDLLVVEGNGSPDQIGRVAKWDGSIAPCVHQNHLIKVRVVVAEPDWVLNWLVSPGGRKQIELVSSSTTGLHTLSSGKVGHLPVPLPPVAEQQRIVLEVDRRLSLIRGVEAGVDANLKRAQALRQATLTTAFQDGFAN